VYFEGEAQLGEIVELELAGAGPNSLAGRLLLPATA
jgi:hypothetical protein